MSIISAKYFVPKLSITYVTRPIIQILLENKPHFCTSVTFADMEFAYWSWSILFQFILLGYVLLALCCLLRLVLKVTREIWGCYWDTKAALRCHLYSEEKIRQEMDDLTAARAKFWETLESFKVQIRHLFALEMKVLFLPKDKAEQSSSESVRNNEIVWFQMVPCS